VNKLVIIEGLDKSGKSTLAKELAKKFKMDYFKSSYDPAHHFDTEESARYDWNFLLDVLSKTKVDIVFDRSFITQYVYSTYFRGSNILKHYSSFEEYHAIFKEYINKFLALGGIIVYLKRQDFDKIKLTDEKFTQKDLINLQIRFDEILENTKINPVTSYFECGKKIVRDIIIKEIQLRWKKC